MKLQPIAAPENLNLYFFSFLGGFPENWATLRDSWALVVKEQRALMDRNEWFSSGLVKEETTEFVEIKAGMVLEFAGGSLVSVEDQVALAAPQEGHFKWKGDPGSSSLLKGIKEEKNVMNRMYGKLVEVKDEVLLDWLDLEPFVNGDKAEETGVFKENLGTDQIIFCHAATVKEMDSEFNIESKVSSSFEESVQQTVAKLDMVGQVSNDVETGVQMLKVKKERKREVGVKNSRGGFSKKLSVKVAVPNCEECGKTFSKNSKRLLHINVVHRKVMPYKCEIGGCNRGFASRRDREEHIRVVHNNLPFTCPMENCAKTFTSKTNCTAHVNMVHLKHRPYVCPYPHCGVQVTRRFALDYHKRAVHGEPKLGCPVQGCGQEFNLSWQLAVHVRHYHYAAT